MNSNKFHVFFALFLLCFSVNVFADYKFELVNAEVFTIANPDGSGNDGQGFQSGSVNAYYSKHMDPAQLPAPYASHEILTDARISAENPTGLPADWVDLELTFKNISTTAEGNPRPVNLFWVRIDRYGMVEGTVEPRYLKVFYDGRGGGGNPNPAFDDGYTTQNGTFLFGATRTFNIPMRLNDIQNNLVFYGVKSFEIAVAYEIENPEPDQYHPLIDLSRNWFLGSKQVDIEVYDPEPFFPPLIDDLNAFLDPITCFDSTGTIQALGSGGNGESTAYDPIRCDLVDSNTINYTIMFEDINVQHQEFGNGHYMVVDNFTLFCNTVSNPVLDGENQIVRTMHLVSGCPLGLGCYYEGPQYNGFSQSCDFLHYASNQPGDSYCYIDRPPVATAYSVPPVFTPIPDCSTAWPNGCPEQDKNVFYNTNGIQITKFLGENSDPSADFKFYFGDKKFFKGTITNAETGGNFKCTGHVWYSLYDAAGNYLNPPVNTYPDQIVGQEPLNNTSDNTGTYTSGWRGHGHGAKYGARLLKLKGHDAFITSSLTFMPTSPFIRPGIDWTVELPIRNNGLPWNGATPEDVLYVDVNVITPTWLPISETFLLDGSAPVADHTLNLDDEKLFYVAFPINEGLYHNFLTAAAIKAKLYNEKGWVFDWSKEKPVTNVRLITILNPLVYGTLGDACFTDPSWEIFCWINYLPYSINPINLNAGENEEFILRLKNPFDFNEFFALTYETNGPQNARVEFDPQLNFVSPFTSLGEFGYKYAKMTLLNPEILHDDTNYTIIDTSVSAPYVWDNVIIEIKNFYHNLRIENFSVTPVKEKYLLGDVLNYSLSIKNTGDSVESDINFLVESDINSNEFFHAPNGTNINPGQTITFTGTFSPISSKDVFVIKASVDSVPFESDISDNQKTIVIETAYQGNVSNLPETNHIFILLVLFVVLFVVRKK